MEANGSTAVISSTINSDMENYLNKGLEVSSQVDTTLARCSDKLAILEKILSQFVAEENHVVANGFENDVISEELIEKIFTFDLLCAILCLELREVDDLMDVLQDLILDSLREISSCENSTDFSINGLVRRLHESEGLVKTYRDHVLEMEIHLAKLQMTSFSSARHDWNHAFVRIFEQKGSLGMFEKSLAHVLELEKKLKDLKRNEEDFKSKLRLVEQVAFCMEEAAEVAWGRFLEADYTAELLMGISRDTLEKLRIAQINLSRSTETEEEKTRELQDFKNQLHVKDTLIEKLNSEISRLVADNAEVKSLREKSAKLEDNLKITESKLDEANALKETSQKRLKETESEIEALREKLHATQSRAERAEEKSTHLNVSNIELLEEVDFLKGSNDSNTKKVSMLEKQLRELDIQLQHSESSQEQQNMLYLAILDMEILIDELKQKVVKAESKTDSAEDRCVILSEKNSDINKELEFMRSRVDILEKSLSQAAREKKSYAKDISIRSSRIKETVLQLATERERIRKQLISCTKENKLLRAKLLKEQKNTTVILYDKKSCGEKEFQLSRLDSVDSESTKTFAVNATGNSSETLQEKKLSVDVIPDDKDERGVLSSTNHVTDSVVQLEAERFDVNKNYRSRKTFVFVTILVVLLSSLAAHFFEKKNSIP